MKRLLLILLLALPAQAANEIRAFEAGASTCFAVVRETDGDVWYVSGQVFEAWGTGARTADDYDIALTDKSGGMFVGNMDTNIGSGQYYIITHMQAGGSPADSDPAVFQEYGDWDGATWTPSTIATDVASITAKLPTNYIMGSSTQADQDTIIHGGTVPDNTSTEDSIKLAAGASGANDIYNENLVVLISGTGSGQARLIADYIGGTQTAVVRHSWTITPDNTTVYRIYPFSGILLANTGLVAGATSTSLTLNASAPATADIYDGHTVYISGGTGEGQARLITGYTAGRVATVYPAWDVTPAASASVYIVLPIGVGEIYDTVAAIKAMTDLIAVVTTTVSDANDANSFTLTAGEPTDEAYFEHIIMVEDADDSHAELRFIKEWNATRVLLVEQPFSFTPAVGDNVWIMGTGYGGWLYEIWNKLWRLQTPVFYYRGPGTSGGGTGGAGGVTQYDSTGNDP